MLFSVLKCEMCPFSLNNKVSVAQQSVVTVVDSPLHCAPWSFNRDRSALQAGQSSTYSESVKPN